MKWLEFLKASVKEKRNIKEQNQTVINMTYFTEYELYIQWNNTQSILNCLKTILIDITPVKIGYLDLKISKQKLSYKTMNWKSY